MTESGPHDAPEITYDEHFYPARPRPLRPSVRRVRTPGGAIEPRGSAAGDNPLYIEWLVGNSMLQDANQVASQLAGQGSMWQNPFAHPDPNSAAARAAVWFTAYPSSLITRPGQSYLQALGDEELWQAFADIGIDAVHTGPVKRAGGLRGWDNTPSIDGHFDRVSMQIDPAFGTEDDFRQICEVAAQHGGVVIDDVVPGHTGKGADFRLAEMRYADYPGIYHMVEINPNDWGLLPTVPLGADATNLSADAEAQLEKAGYIIGQLQRVIFYQPGVKETNWSATSPVVGVDGTERRWVYLHYFKAGQPSINWLDPSCAGMRLVIGDACHSLADLGSVGLRLDANGFLGVEKSAEGSPAWSEGHPLSEAANHLIASMVRKMGGFTFQELNLSIDDIAITAESGADLSYDFVNRPAYHHALVTGNTEFLRLTLNLSLSLGVQPGSLVHALQNHDELTHELVHFSTRHHDDLFTFGGEELTGAELGQKIRVDLCDGLTGDNAPYNLTFTTNGIACTTASVIAASIGITDLAEIDEEQRAKIQQIHLLLAMFNAFQPGVFALSGWDICGMLTIDIDKVGGLIEGGDTRWINRGAHDLMGVNPVAQWSSAGLPKARSLYGTLPDQLSRHGSFARNLSKIIEVRRQYSLSTGIQLDVPNVGHAALLVMVHKLDSDEIQVTILNFCGDVVGTTVHSEHLLPQARVIDMITEEDLGVVDELFNFPILLQPYEGRALLLRPAEPEPEE